MDILAALFDWLWLSLGANHEQAYKEGHKVLALSLIWLDLALAADTEHVPDRCGWWRKLVVLKTSVNEATQHSCE